MTTTDAANELTSGNGAAGAGRPSLAEDARRLAAALGKLIAVLEFRDRDRASAHGLTASQWYALRAVTEAGGLSVNQLAGAIYVSKSGASRIAAGLVDRELLAREALENDARGVRLATTPEGSALCASIRADEERDAATLLGELDSSARAEACRAITWVASVAAASVETEGGSCWVVR